MQPSFNFESIQQTKPVILDITACSFLKRNFGVSTMLIRNFITHTIIIGKYHWQFTSYITQWTQLLRHTVFKVWTLFITGQWIKNTSFTHCIQAIHCNRIDVILGVSWCVRCVAAGCERSSLLSQRPWPSACRVDFGRGKDGWSANFLFWLVEESWGSVLPCRSVGGERDIFELQFRIDRGCWVFGNRERTSREPGRTILCGLNRARTARCATPKFWMETPRANRTVRTQETGDYQVPVRLGFLLKGSLLHVIQGIHVERLLCYCEMVLQLVHFVDLRHERCLDTGKFVCRQYR
jgi:hypothetical protein